MSEVHRDVLGVLSSCARWGAVPALWLCLTTTLLVACEYEGADFASLEPCFGYLALGILAGLVARSLLVDGLARRSDVPPVLWAVPACLLPCVLVCVAGLDSRDGTVALGSLQGLALLDMGPALGLPMTLPSLLRLLVPLASILVGLAWVVWCIPGAGGRIPASNVNGSVALSRQALPYVAMTSAASFAWGLSRAHAWAYLLPYPAASESDGLSVGVGAGEWSAELVPGIVVAPLLAAAMLTALYGMRDEHGDLRGGAGHELCAGGTAEALFSICLGELGFRLLSRLAPVLYAPTWVTSSLGLAVQLACTAVLLCVTRRWRCRVVSNAGSVHDCPETGLEAPVGVDSIMAGVSLEAISRMSHYGLTEREKVSFCGMTRGMTSREVSEAMGVSPSTVREYVRRSRSKIGEEAERLSLLLAATPEPPHDDDTGVVAQTAESSKSWRATLAFCCALILPLGARGYGGPTFFQVVVSLSLGAFLAWVILRTRYLGDCGGTRGGNGLARRALVGVSLPVVMLWRAATIAPAYLDVPVPLTCIALATMSGCVSAELVSRLHVRRRSDVTLSLECAAILGVGFVAEELWRSVGYLALEGEALAFAVLLVVGVALIQRESGGRYAWLLVASVALSIVALAAGLSVPSMLLSFVVAYGVVTCPSGQDEPMACSSSRESPGFLGTPLRLDVPLFFSMGMMLAVVLSNAFGWGLTYGMELGVGDHLSDLVRVALTAVLLSTGVAGAAAALSRSVDAHILMTQSEMRGCDEERIAHALAARGLDEREVKVVVRLAAGQTIAEVATDLMCSRSVINTARSRAYRLLDVHTRAELVRFMSNL